MGTTISDRASEQGSVDRIAGFDGVRAIAVLVVLVSHLWPILPALWGNGLYRQFTEGGFLGVNAFFVLSGFLITHRLTLDSGRHTREVIRRFLVARTMRIVPLLLLFLALHLAYVLVVGVPPEFTLRDEALGIVATVLQFSNYAILASSQILADNVGIWSLSIEGQFYLVAPLVVLPLVRRRFDKTRAVITIMAITYVVSVANMARVYALHGWESAYLRTDTRVSAILLGVFGCLLWQRMGVLRPARERLAALSACIGIIVMFSLARADGDLMWFGGMAVFDVSVLVVIVMLARGTFPGMGLLDSPIMRRTGRISYGLYLWQIPVIRLLARHAPHMNESVRAAIALLLIFGLSALTWHTFERPIVESNVTRRLKGAALTPSPRK